MESVAQCSMDSMISINKKTVSICSLILLLGGAFLSYYFHFNPTSDPSNFVSCPSKTFFGLNCPGCGSQRMIHHLLHFNLSQAFRYNPLLFITLPFVLFILFQSLVNFVFGTNYRTKLFYNNTFVWTVFGVLMVYAVLRNLPFYPFLFLAPPP